MQVWHQGAVRPWTNHPTAQASVCFIKGEGLIVGCILTFYWSQMVLRMSWNLQAHLPPGKIHPSRKNICWCIHKEFSTGFQGFITVHLKPILGPSEGLGATWSPGPSSSLPCDCLLGRSLHSWKPHYSVTVTDTLHKSLLNLTYINIHLPPFMFLLNNIRKRWNIWIPRKESPALAFRLSELSQGNRVQFSKDKNDI